MNTHEYFMEIALELAKKGLGMVSPNPMVGCVIVKNGEIIGEGWHQKYGEAHAEPNAVKDVGDLSKIYDSTVYVTLEPCAHFGKTPPCAELLARLKPKKVVVANLDTNPLVAGKGIEILKNAGIEVIAGVLEQKARNLNKRFFTFFEKQRPYIILKWAESSDGFISGDNFKKIQISGVDSMLFSHQLRANEDAILVGTNTAFYDNPKLDTRLVEGKNPLRVFIDKTLKLPDSHSLLDCSTPTICFNFVKDEQNENLLFERISGEVLPYILESLHRKKIGSLIVEGGSVLLQSFIDRGLWDEAFVIQSTKAKLRNGTKAPKIDVDLLLGIALLGEDKLLNFKNNI